MQAYSDPTRENDPYSLPDIEVFYSDGYDIFECGYFGDCESCGAEGVNLADGFGAEQNLCLTCAREQYGSGYYWRYCFPGCMPDSDPFGPFKTADEAVKDAQNQE